MSTNDKPEADNPFKKWYATHKEALSLKRKKKYQSDPAHREAVKARQADYRASHPTPSRAGEARFKQVNGKTVEVFRIGEVGAMIGRSDQTIRDWEAQEIIPKPTVKSPHRYYTKVQVSLMKGLADLIDVVRHDGNEVLSAAIATKSAEIHKKWKTTGG